MSDKKPGQISNEDVRKFSKLMIFLCSAAVLATTRRLLVVHDDWILGVGNLINVVLLVTAVYANTVLKLPKEKTGDFVPNGESSE